MDNFEKLLKMTVGEKKPTSLEVQIDAAKEELEEKRAKLERLENELAAKKKAATAAEREIVLRYTPHVPGSVKVVKGQEFIEPNKPDNVVALLDAAASIMAKEEGISQFVLTNALLQALMDSMETQILMKGLLANDK